MKKFFIIAAVMLLLPVGIISAGFSMLGQARVRAYVSVDGASVRGMSEGELRNFLYERARLSAEDKSLVIRGKEKEYRFYYPEIDSESNAEEIVAAALSCKKKEKKDFKLQSRFYLKNADKIVEKIERENYCDPVDAEIRFYPDRREKFAFIEESEGYATDAAALKREIYRALNSEKDNVVECIYKSIPASVCKEELESYTHLRASFSTYYGSSTSERKHNIALAAKQISGESVESGGVLSFNQSVGPRTEANGFLNAKIISEGKFVDGVGGGVCQVSTTLYNAALLAGLRITEYHPHSLSVSYVKPSRDAMVNGSGADLKIENTSGGRIFIAAYADGENIRFDIYGKEPEFKYEIVSNVLEEISPPDPEIITEQNEEYGGLKEGETLIIENEKVGIISESYLIKKSGGQVISKIRLRKDNYKAVRGKIVVGAKKQPVQKEQPWKNS